MGKFLLGFVVGVAIGAAVVALTAPQSGDETRASFQDTLREAIDAARNAATLRENELWTQLRTQMSQISGGSEPPFRLGA